MKNSSDKKILQLGELWSCVKTPSLAELLSTVDEAIVEEIHNEKSGAALNAFTFFNTPSGLTDRPFRPLNPREYLQYWISLTDEQKLFFAVFPEEIE